METVRAREVTVPTFGFYIKRKLKIVCGNCRRTFEDNPTIAKDMYSKCPFCGKVNLLPVTAA